MSVEQLIRPWIADLKPYSSARDEFSGSKDGITFLDANENPFETGVNRYPDPRQRSLKAILARAKGVRQDQMILGNGSDEILDLLFRIFCEPGQDKVMILPPTYGMYKVLADINRIECQVVPLDDDFLRNDVSQASRPERLSAWSWRACCRSSGLSARWA